MAHKHVEPLTEELQYSDDFAQMILEQEDEQFTEIDGDTFIATLDKMIAEAATNGQATRH